MCITGWSELSFELTKLSVRKGETLCSMIWFDCIFKTSIKFAWTSKSFPETQVRETPLKDQYIVLCRNRNCKELKRKIGLVSSANTADSASCHNFLFCEDKIANGFSDDYAKEHKSPIFQEIKPCSQKQQGRATEESYIFISKCNLSNFHASHMQHGTKNLFGPGPNWLGWSLRVWKFRCNQSMPGRLCKPCLDCSRGDEWCSGTETSSTDTTSKYRNQLWGPLGTTVHLTFFTNVF